MFRSLKILAILLALGLALPVAAQDKPAKRFGFGTPATTEQIAGWNIDVRGPDGAGLPPGKGSVAAGEELFMAQCAACHGEFAEGAGRYPELIGGRGTLKSDDPRKTIDSYWPHGPSLYDYIYRAMPFGAPQSLTHDEVYSIVAWLLNQGDLWPADKDLDAASLKALKLPNRDGFITGGDPRPDVKPDTCMTNCRTAPPKITSDLAARLGVTPTQQKAAD
ncbi:MAG: cytochrome c [Ferrovibrio sp.]|uniref:c-type cytochrome n=1 Tax=Ferrovibrio sp. TaxID=1917215 RepID=UPI00262F14D4|nr:cytochrome c [Ferrovibrio sp.]MCW0233345.1 cytochrome c [Ferrovibrio sp.]